MRLNKSNKLENNHKYLFAYYYAHNSEDAAKRT